MRQRYESRGRRHRLASCASWAERRGSPPRDDLVETSLDLIRGQIASGTYDIGTLINQKTGTNQLIGGVVWGVSMALHEQTLIDPTYGRTVNENLAEYHVPVNADARDIEVIFVDPDPPGVQAVG